MRAQLHGSQRKWVRSSNGWIAGVCEGLGKSFGIEPWIIRLLWLFSIFAFGTGILFYFILAFCMPREDRTLDSETKKLMGVCLRISKSTGVEIGLVRAAAVLLGIVAFGSTLIGYIVLYFILPEDEVESNTVIV